MIFWLLVQREMMMACGGGQGRMALGLPRLDLTTASRATGGLA
jgi:hypothetical protein